MPSALHETTESEPMSEQIDTYTSTCRSTWMRLRAAEAAAARTEAAAAEGPWVGVEARARLRLAVQGAVPSY